MLPYWGHIRRVEANWKRLDREANARHKPQQQLSQCFTWLLDPEHRDWSRRAQSDALVVLRLGKVRRLIKFATRISVEAADCPYLWQNKPGFDQQNFKRNSPVPNDLLRPTNRRMWKDTLQDPWSVWALNSYTRNIRKIFTFQSSPSARLLAFQALPKSSIYRLNISYIRWIVRVTWLQ